jgi:hypothetical protein
VGISHMERNIARAMDEAAKVLQAMASAVEAGSCCKDDIWHWTKD